MIGSVLFCSLLNLIIFHFWLTAKKLNEKGSIRFLSKYYYSFKSLFGLTSMFFAFFAGGAPRIVNHFTSLKCNIDQTTWAVTTLITYPILYLGYYYLFEKMNKRKKLK